MSIKATAVTAARSGTFPVGRPYKYQGRPGWVPGADATEQALEERPSQSLPMKLYREQRRAAAQARREQFAVLRAEGRTVKEAAEAVGVSADCGRKYEARRLREAAG